MGCSKCEKDRLKKDNDTLARHHTFTRDKYICQRCKDEKAGHEWAHYISRGNWATRWEPDNLITLCCYCHIWAHLNPDDFIQFMIDRLGPARHDILMEMKNSYFKRDFENLKNVNNRLQSGF